MTTLLTICILSYNRYKSLELLIDSANPATLPNDVSLLIRDDSGIQFCKKLESKYSGMRNIEFSYNNKNLGYAASFVGAFKGIESRYIMYVSDDDMIDRGELDLLLTYLRSSGESFVSTKWCYGNKISGRNINASDKQSIKLTQVRQASNHAPGLVWKREDATRFIDIIENRLNTSCSFVYFYPQVALLYMLMLSNLKCCILPLAPVNEGHLVEPSNLVSRNERRSYIHPSEAVSENICYNEFCREVLSIFDSQKAKALADLNQAKLFQDIAFALKLSSDATYESFVADSCIYIVRHRLSLIFLDVIKLLRVRLFCKIMLLK